MNELMKSFGGCDVNVKVGGSRWTVGLGVVSGVIIAASMSGPPAIASEIGCGMVVTTDLTLHEDLTGCVNVGLVIGADDVTVDLNGHRLGGDGTPFEQCESDSPCDVGLDNSSGHPDVTVLGGTIQGFDIGVFVSGADRNRVTEITTLDTAFAGVLVGESADVRVDHSVFEGGVVGIVAFDSVGTRAHHNRVTGTSGYAMPFFRSPETRVEQNSFENDQHGILLDGSDTSVIRGNTLNDAAIEIAHTGGAKVSGNALSGNDGVLLIEAVGNEVSHNTITDTGSADPEVGGFGILFDGSDDNLVVGNVVTGARGPAIWVTTLESSGTSDGNVISGNRVANSHLEAIWVDSTATNTELNKNRSNGNALDGFTIDAPSTTLTHNTANDNGDLGIDAVSGVIDGGGNRASGNGDPAECTNITCS
ncbi:MAG TPA: right-handed parallel beta-helix repeat-containing protein [Agromyces sp.]|nr:right-handed parallel beta-helix repeat-containing protein [Agromyces sp.]